MARRWEASVSTVTTLITYNAEQRAATGKRFPHLHAFQRWPGGMDNGDGANHD